MEVSRGCVQTSSAEEDEGGFQSIWFSGFVSLRLQEEEELVSARRDVPTRTLWSLPVQKNSECRRGVCVCVNNLAEILYTVFSHHHGRRRRFVVVVVSKTTRFARSLAVSLEKTTHTHAARRVLALCAHQPMAGRGALDDAEAARVHSDDDDDDAVRRRRDGYSLLLLLRAVRRRCSFMAPLTRTHE